MPEHQTSFEKIKEMLTSNVTMAYFDPDKVTEWTTDASPVGLSAILSQKTPGRNDRKIIAYASCDVKDAICKWKRKLLPLCGQLNDFTSESLSLFSLIANQFN